MKLNFMNLKKIKNLKRLLEEKAKSITGIHQWPFRALARSFEVIPRTLIQNCGANVIRTLTALRAKHAQEGNSSWGVDGNSGELVDMKTLGIWEPLAVKQQTYKTAIEVCVLKVDHFKQTLLIYE
jgi:T-complex protein 1 subunit gamma